MRLNTPQVIMHWGTGTAGFTNVRATHSTTCLKVQGGRISLVYSQKATSPATADDLVINQVETIVSGGSVGKLQLVNIVSVMFVPGTGPEGFAGIFCKRKRIN